MAGLKETPKMPNEAAYAGSFPDHFFGHWVFADEIIQLYKKGKLPHGILLQGAKGIGKMRVAKCLAQALLFGDLSLLKKNVAHENLSNAQQKIRFLLNSGACANLKVVSLDDSKQASFRTISIEAVKAVNDFFALKSQDDNWRVAIIDSVDDLSPKGANAFLKTLEEPPEKSLLILLSHATGHVLPTIRSRCQVFGLSPLTQEDTQAVISNFEGVEGALKTLVSLAKGRPGLAKNLLKLGGAPLSETLEKAISRAEQGDRSELLTIVEILFTNAQFEKDDETFRAFIEFVLDLSASRIIDQAVDQGNNLGKSSLPDVWFSCIRQAQDTITYSLDKKASCLSILHQLTSRQACTLWSKSS